MRFIVTTAFILGILALPQGAPAQQTPASPSAVPAQPQAPVGHRQPRGRDAKTEPGADEPKPAERELDKVLHSICRGC
jgi:hypothetical protein